MPADRLRLLCCSDTHDRLPPALPENGAAAWLHAGDVFEDPGAGFEPVAGFEDRDHPDVAAWAEARSIRVLAVRGNHDVADPFGFFTASRDLTGRVERLAPDLLVAGVGWAGRWSIAPPFDSELEEVCASVAGQVDRARRDGDRVVLLSHYSMASRGLHPGDDGDLARWTFPSVTALAQAIAPALVVQGHLHEWAGRSARLPLRAGGAALLVNPGPEGMIVELTGRRASIARTGVASKRAK